jgi:selenide,water dikinase
MQAPIPLTRDLVFVGGGHAHALVLRRWGMRPLPGARLTLINPGPTAPYTGMLPGFVAGHYGRAALDIDLVRLARFAGARLILDRVEGIDRAAGRLHLAGRPPVAYDIASLDVGITSDMPELPGFAAHGVPAKPLDQFADRWSAFLDRPGPVAVIGGGVGGIELALAMHHALSQTGGRPEITVIEARKILSATSLQARTHLLQELARRHIKVLEGVEAAEVGPDILTVSDGREIPAALTVGAAGARPHAWLAETGLAVSEGYLKVDRFLRTSDPAIYASGDCAHLTHAPRPKAGVFAVRAAPVLAHNLRADLSGRARKAFRPQRDYLKLISLGRTAAVAEKFGLALSGDWAWVWKDRIDRAFMDRLNHPPQMARPSPLREAARDVRGMMAGTPLCGGCGAKVGPAILFRALQTAGTNEAGLRPGDDGAVLSVGDRSLILTTDHLRAVTEDPYVMARIALEHALGDIWAMGARPRAALLTLTLPPMSEPLQGRWLDEVLAGIGAGLEPTGAVLAGGHTSQGAEFSIGLTLAGDPVGAPIGLDGAKPGDRLILTRPIGSGTLFAAEMAGKAKGADMAGLLRHLQVSQQAAASCLTDAHALTDVTGFGLAGHLMTMAEASGVTACLALPSIPVFPGAEDLARSGVRSSLYPANRARPGLEAMPDSGVAALLFDPQTAGGLLAAVPEASAEAVFSDLRNAGYPAVIVGKIENGPPQIRIEEI